MTSNSFCQSQDSSQKSRKGRCKEDKFAGKFNTRTQKLIELSKSNSCTALPFTRRDSDGSTSRTSIDELSQSSGSVAINRERQRLKRMQEREKVKPLELDVKEQGGLPAATKLLYDELLGKKASLLAFDTLLATLRAHVPGFWASECEDVGESVIRKLIRENLLLSTGQLADKYLTRSGRIPVDEKVSEYKLQTMLTLFATFSEDCDDTTGESAVEDFKLCEVVELLRMISASADTSAMQSFLNNDVLDTFVNRIPRYLTRIYEELYQTVPSELSSYACHVISEDSEHDASIFISPNAKCIRYADDSSSQNSRRARGRPSFISTRHHKQLTVSSNNAKQLKVKAEKKNDRGGNKKETGRPVRKSLTFDSQSNSKQQTPMKKRIGTAITKASSRTPKRKRASTALVDETPPHKQRPLSEYRREKYQRMSGTVRQIIAETPQKESPSFAGTRKSPRNHPSAKASFTSAPTALTQINENFGCTNAVNPATTSVNILSPSPAKPKGGLFEAFLNYKSPKKRFGKVVRALSSPAKPIWGQDANASKPLDFSSLRP